MIFPRITVLWLALTIASADPPGPPTDEYLKALTRFESYAESVWQEVEAVEGGGFFGDGQCTGNGGIRGSSGIAVAYATLVRVGVEGDRQRRLDRVNGALLYAAATHKTGKKRCVDGEQWGHSWQSAMWAGSLGLAALLLEKDLPAETLNACQRVIASEADRLVSIPPPSGHIGDSKAEENAWNSNVLSLAAAWMPEHEQASHWLQVAKLYLVNTYTVPGNENGPLSDWICTTTMYPSYTVENHGSFQSSYLMVAGMSLGDSLLMARIGDPSVAEAVRPFAEHNTLNAWDSLSHLLLDSGDLAHPAGLSWALHGYNQVSYYAWLARHFRNPLATWAENKLVRLIADRQQIYGDGSFFGPSIQDSFYREAVLARRVAIACLHHEYTRSPPQTPTPPEPRVAHWPDVKVILQRSSHGMVAISYGSQPMIQVIPTSRGFEQQPFVVTPLPSGIFGPVENPGQGGVRLHRFEGSNKGFSAVFNISRHDSNHTLFIVESREDIFAVLEVPMSADDRGLPALGFPIGIENDPLTGESRHLISADGTEKVRAFSGRELGHLGSWVNIDDRLGMIVGPAARLGYRTAPEFNRRGAAEDTLFATRPDGTNPSYAIFLSAATSQMTNEVQRSVEYMFDGCRAVLSVVSPGGEHVVLESTADPGCVTSN